MRVTVSAAILCAALCIIGVFLPAGHLGLRTRVGRLDIGSRVGTVSTSRSLYQLGVNSDAVRDFVDRYRQSTGRKLGGKALDKVAPRLPDALRWRAEELQYMNASLDAIRDEDLETVGTATAATMWSLLGLDVLAIILLFGIGARTSRLRVAAALVVSLLAAALAVAVYLVLGRVVLEANRELRSELFSLRGGAHLMPAAAVASFAATVATLVLYIRARGRLAPPPMAYGHPMVWDGGVSGRR